MAFRGRHAFIHVIEVSVLGTTTTIHRCMGQRTGLVILAKRTARRPTSGLDIGVLHIAWTMLCICVCIKHYHSVRYTNSKLTVTIFFLICWSLQGRIKTNQAKKLRLRLHKNKCYYVYFPKMYIATNHDVIQIHSYVLSPWWSENKMQWNSQYF